MSTNPTTSTLSNVAAAVEKVTELVMSLMQANMALKTALMIHAATLKDAPAPGPPPPTGTTIPRTQE